MLDKPSFIIQAQSIFLADSEMRFLQDAYEICRADFLKYVVAVQLPGNNTYIHLQLLRMGVVFALFMRMGISHEEDSRIYGEWCEDAVRGLKETGIWITEYRT